MDSKDKHLIPTPEEPIEQIRPHIETEQAVNLAKELYGFTKVEGKELNGYDDKNFHLKATSVQDNLHIPTLHKSGYVLKILNSNDSKKLDYVEGQTELLVHLNFHGITAPFPLKNKHGQYYSLESIPTQKDKNTTCKSHVVRLLHYIDGHMLKDIPWSYQLFYDVGKTVAQLDQVLENFYHKGCFNYDSMWMLKNAPRMLDFLFAVNNEHSIKVVKEVVTEFQETVLPKLNILKSGFIHGDANEQNILCVKNSAGEWIVHSLLDYGDAHYSAYVFDLAIAMTYMILQSEDLLAGGYVMSGYSAVKHLPSDEIALLATCISTRICQSLVMGAFSHLRDPENNYILSTQKSGWKMLLALRQNLNSIQDLWSSCKL